MVIIVEMTFWLVLGVIIVQRVVELGLSKRHTAWMRAQGGQEYGREHYPWMVALHLGFLLSMLLEHLARPVRIFPAFWVPIILAQALRYSAIWALGNFWNTRVWILPGAAPVRRGIYRLFPHPNYAAVVLEIFCIPALFGLWVTAVLFTLLNAWMLSLRIRVENRALGRHRFSG